MNLKTKLAAAMVLAASASMAQATTYNVHGVFTEPTEPMGGTVGPTIFDGTFDWDGTTLTNFTGAMNSSMASMDLDMNLQYNPVGVSYSGNTVTASAFLVNSTNVFWGGGYATGGIKRYGGYLNNNLSSWDGNTINNNAYFKFSFDSTSMAGILSSMVYGDCTPAGMMGNPNSAVGMNTCMTGFGSQNASGLGPGTMGAWAESLTITEVAAVPVPAAAWLFGGALISLFGVNRRKSVLPA